MSDAYEALRIALAFSSHDWSLHSGDAWLYGIVLGWDCELGDIEPGENPGAAMEEVAARHGWDENTVATLRKLHQDFKDAPYAD